MYYDEVLFIRISRLG